MNVFHELRVVIRLFQDSFAVVIVMLLTDMISMLKLDYTPSVCEFIHSGSDPEAAIAVADSASPNIRVYDAHGGSNQPIHVLDTLHTMPVTLIKVIKCYVIKHMVITS